MPFADDSGLADCLRRFDRDLPPTRHVLGGADLHVHTSASDGVLAPGEVVARAAQAGLEALAITDHDTLGGLHEAGVAAVQHGIEVVPGIELSAEDNGHEVHVLGYYVELNDHALNGLLARLRNARSERAAAMVERLGDLGIQLSLDAVLKEAGPGSVGRPHVARVLVDRGYVASTTEAFERFLGHGKPAYVPRYKLTPARAVEVLHRAGAVTSLAHPCLIGAPEAIPRLLRLGFDAIEVRHSEQSRDDEYALWRLTCQFGLAVTGGSDWHGDDREERSRLGASRIPLQLLRFLRELHQVRGGTREGDAARNVEK